ncbi:N-glycosylase/DNA lyase [Candidatus Woesearchaeota archaeon]|jgi:N-glycosylase/DNA lyase|nr:N-glycosylase/DNA lyase [Candidatus Woesearchaeota archaeon]MBT6518226.1 N-glycosylase/DNA lyase [Candidatus Woesearchaeota archaeon]MBT7368640.1 N-glycosylase/DNA lyase [Candidatus Woesearchaeota archaeon]
MKQILSELNKLKKSNIKKIVDSRISEFEKLGRGNNKTLFKELCFCLLTANFQAEKSIEIQKVIGDRFVTLSELQLAKKLRALGHRFPNVRAKYIVQARKHKDNLRNVLKKFENSFELREWIVKNVKGIGYKEASHFLRNIGYKDLAILDFHIIDILVECGLVERPKTITPKQYLEIEKGLDLLGTKSRLNQAELDLYLWYLETGKIFK